MNFRSKFFKQPYGDQGLIIHRTTYFKNNGFRKIPLMEDVDFLRRLNKKKDLKQSCVNLVSACKNMSQSPFEFLAPISNCKPRFFSLEVNTFAP